MMVKTNLRMMDPNLKMMNPNLKMMNPNRTLSIDGMRNPAMKLWWNANPLIESLWTRHLWTRHPMTNDERGDLEGLPTR